MKLYRLLLLSLFCFTPLAHAQPLQKQVALPTPEESSTAAYSVAGSSAEGDEHWDDRFGMPGVDFYAYTAATAPNGDVYVGGWFTKAGNIVVNNIARWDGRRWHALGSGLDGYVYSIAIAPNGDVYAGGYFTNAGTVRVNSVAKWTPATQTWSALGSGLVTSYDSKASVHALALRGNELYAGGDFEKSGQTATRKLARWNGTAWQEIGPLGRFDYQGTFEPNGSGTVHSLLTSGDDVYVAGYFEAVSGVRAQSLVRFNAAAQTWHAVGGGVDQGSSYASYGTINALEMHGNELYVGGVFKKAGPFEGGVFANNVARWNGTTWSALGTGIEAQYTVAVRGLLSTPEGLYVTGNFDTAGGQQARHLARWSNGAWSQVGGGLASPGRKLARGADGSVIITGEFDTAGENVRVNRVAKWDGTSFIALGEGLTYSSIRSQTYALAAGGGRVYAGGYQTHSGGLPTNMVSMWNGVDWEALGEGLGGGSGYVYAAVLAANGDVFVGGSFTTAGGRSANHVARWNAATRSWSALANGVNNTVYSLALAPNGDLYAGGSFTAAGSVPAMRIARWDGTTWHTVGTGANYTVESVAVAADGKVYIGGDFDQVGGGRANGVAIWNGANWSALGNGVTSAYGGAADVHSIVVWNNEVYVAGDFVTAGTVAAAGVAKWNPTTGWAPLGTGLGGSYQTGNALVRNGNLLYIGGDFETAGGERVNNIAVWDLAAQTWRGLGSGINGVVNSLALDGNVLWVGGRFELAGGKSSAAIARWTGDANVVTQGQISVDPTTVNFGEVALAQSTDRAITIRNEATATGPLTGTVGALAAPFSIVSGGGAFTLAPGASHTVTVRFNPAVAGAAQGTLAITHNGGNTPSPLNVTLSGTGVTGGNRVVILRNFDPNGPQMIWRPNAASGSGFVFGPNSYGDRAKAVTFTPPAGKSSARVTLNEIHVWFAYKGPMVGQSTYTLRLFNGDAVSGPTGNALFSQSYPISAINADEDPNTRESATVHRLPQPVEVNGPFFVVIDFTGYQTNNTDLAAIAASDRIANRVPDVWEQWSDGTWHNLSDAWTGSNSAPGTGTAGWNLWIEARGLTPTSNEDEEGLPTSYALSANHPNPFHDRTAIQYGLPQSGHVTLRVFDVTGRVVATLVDGVVSAGTHTVTFDGEGLGSGIYFCRIDAGGFTQTQRMVLVK